MACLQRVGHDLLTEQQHRGIHLFFSSACCLVAHMIAYFTFKYLIHLSLLLHMELM